MNSHSNIACPPETFFMQHFFSMLRDSLTVAGFSGFGYSNEEVPREIGRWASQYHEMFRVAEGKGRWADKTPQYALHLHSIEEMFGPHCQYVMIYRHPLDVVHSLVERRWTFRKESDDLWVDNALYLKDVLKNQREFVRQNPDRCVAVFYENLVTDAEAVLRVLFDFLGEEFEPDVMEFNKKDHGFGTEDPVVRGTTQFLQNFGNWRSSPGGLVKPAIDILGDEMAFLGYSVDRNQPHSVR